MPGDVPDNYREIGARKIAEARAKREALERERARAKKVVAQQQKQLKKQDKKQDKKESGDSCAVIGLALGGIVTVVSQYL